MIVKITNASKKDRFKATISLKALERGDFEILDTNGCSGSPLELSQGDEFIAAVDGVKTVFIVNREGRTACTKALPRLFRMPAVGKPIYASVDPVAFLI